MSATADQELAELRRAYEDMRSERDSALAALARRNTEYGERIDYQAATIDVLKAMSASPGDPQPVFNLIVERARDLCDAYGATVFEFDGTKIHWRAATGVSDDPAVRAAYEAQFPMVPTRGWAFGRAILDRRIIRIDDMEAEPGLDPTLRGITAKSNVTIPIMRGDAVIGAIGMGSREKGGFSDSQVELLKTFAEQAAIAITSAETYRALQTRTTDLQQSLEYQTATSDVLKVISSSNFSLEPVFRSVVYTAVRLCHADQAVIYRFEDGAFRWAAGTDMLPEYERIERAVTIRPGTGTVIGRAALEAQPVQILDAWTDPLYAVKDDARAGGVHTLLGVPLLRNGVPIGAIGLARRRVEAYSDREVELVTTFADQAVIAIENARLVTEQREALEQQTATAEVLQEINASPGDLAPVFDTMLDKAVDLCGAAFGILLTYDGERFHHVAFRSIPAAYVEFMREHPPNYGPENAPGRLALGERLVHVLDITASDAYRSGDPNRRAIADLAGARTLVAVPLRKDSKFIGAIVVFRQEVRPFSEKQIALLENFAAQAVIAMENARLITETHEALEQQTAAAEVLQVINASPGNLAPVFETMLDRAMRLCEGAQGTLWMFNGEQMRATATAGYPSDLAAQLSEWREIHPFQRRLLQGEPVFQIVDLAAEELYRSGNALTKAAVDVAGIRSVVFVGLVKDATTLGGFTIGRREVRAFTAKQVALLENFAAQGVVAMENARLLTETREALEQQTATAEVLQVINTNPGNLAPVFATILEKAHATCGAEIGSLQVWDGTHARAMATLGYPSEVDAMLRRPFLPGPRQQAVLAGARLTHSTDVTLGHDADNIGDNFWGRSRIRTSLQVPLRHDGVVVGFITANRREVRPFSDKEIALLENFASQAVIAMENARLLSEVRQRQEELRITFENMGDGVAMFDAPQRLVAWNSKFQEIFDLPDDLLQQHRTYEEYLRFLAERGDFGAGVDTAEEIDELVASTGQPYGYERTRPDGRVIEIRRNPVPDGGFVLIFSDVTERKRSEAEIRAARDAAEAAYRDLKAAQASLIQAEKMASLGQLTAGIAHEIKNPLNFVNNFASLSVDLLDELKQTAAPGLATLDEARRAEVDDIANTLASNLEKINEHGRRADGIVRGMLEHSRGSSGERREVDLNVLVDEALNLAYHGARAQDQSFKVTLQREFGEGIAPITLAPQDVTRVLLNLISNGFYAARERQRTEATPGFEPTLKVSTCDLDGAVEIQVRDNGIGIPAEVKDRLFQPFFTTKPPGEGTGLGLSMSYDIITQQHGGTICVDSKVGEYSEFTVRLPRR